MTRPTDRRLRLGDEFERHRPHLRGVAYRMLGSVTEADEAVQEAWFRLDRSDPGGQADGGFLIPLPFGDATQWARNLFAAGGGAVRHAGRTYPVDAPEIVERDDAVGLPGVVRRLSGVLGLRQFVRVRAVGD